MPAGSGRYPSGQRGQTVNLLAYAFGGSNPPLPTIVATGSRGNSSAVERQPSKLGVAGSNPVSRSIVAKGECSARDVGGLSEVGAESVPDSRRVVARSPRVVADSPRGIDRRRAHVAQLAEHALGKGEVSGSIPDMGSRFFSPTKRGAHGR